MKLTIVKKRSKLYFKLYILPTVLYAVFYTILTFTDILHCNIPRDFFVYGLVGLFAAMLSFSFLPLIVHKKIGILKIDKFKNEILIKSGNIILFNIDEVDKVIFRYKNYFEKKLLDITNQNFGCDNSITINDNDSEYTYKFLLRNEGHFILFKATITNLVGKNSNIYYYENGKEIF